MCVLYMLRSGGTSPFKKRKDLVYSHAVLVDHSDIANYIHPCGLDFPIWLSIIPEEVGHNHVCSKVGHASQNKRSIHSKKHNNMMGWLDYFKRRYTGKIRYGTIPQSSTFQNPCKSVHHFHHHWTSVWQRAGTNHSDFSLLLLQNTLKHCLQLYEWDGTVCSSLPSLQSLMRPHPKIALYCIPRLCDVVSVLCHVQPPLILEEVVSPMELCKLWP